jgi:hypothetical protein
MKRVCNVVYSISFIFVTIYLLYITLAFLNYDYEQHFKNDVYENTVEVGSNGEPNELYWSHALATELQGEAEYRLDDGARIDILLPKEAIEIDWPKKWAEGVGQALFYGSKTNKTPVVLYLVSNLKEEEKYINRGKIAAKKGGVEVWLYDITNEKWIK